MSEPNTVTGFITERISSVIIFQRYYIAFLYIQFRLVQDRVVVFEGVIW
jgi:hypothetical protein